MSFVEMLLGDNKGNQIILQRGKHSLQNVLILRNLRSQPTSLSIQNLVINLVKIHDADIVKLTLYDTCMYMLHEISYYTIFIHTQTLC